jgi:hypothetical protein
MPSVANQWLSVLEDVARNAGTSLANGMMDRRPLFDSIEELQGAPGGEERQAPGLVG